MNEKKKGFNLFPEYVWMIFVGMLLAILILTNVIPGHAGEVSPVGGSNSVAFSYESPDHPEYVYTSPFRTGVTLDSQGYYNWPDPPQKVFASDDYGVNYTSVINATRFTNDVKLIKGHVGFNFAGTSLVHVSKANFTGYLPGTVQESWYEDFQEAGYTYFGCDLWAFPGDDSSSVPQCIGYILIKFFDNEIPVLSKVNRIYDQEFFQIDFDESKVVETLTYFNEYSWYYWGLDFPNDFIGWFHGSQLGYDGLVDHSGSEHVRVYVKTVNRGDFYFDHVSYNEQYTQNYKYRANVECLDFHREADPEPSPTPEPETYDLIFSNLGVWDNVPHYWLVSFEASNFGKSISVSSTPSPMFSGVVSDLGLSFPVTLEGSTIVFRDQTNYDYLTFYFTADSVSNVVYYNLGSSLVSQDLDILKDTYSPISFSSSNITFGFQQDPLIPGVYGFSLDRGDYKNDTIIKHTFNYNYQTVGNSGSLDIKLFSSDYSLNSLSYYGYKGLLGSGTFVPDPNGPTPTLTPTATPEPLPTSGESIHVILPTGTPTPTPPFTVSGGSDGGSGSGSGSGTPGSIGSGLSSGQTSGVLQAWQLYVSDNPAMIFLSSTFQSLPQELLYPLYILLFILLLLAVIRLFVHFSGG